MSLATRCSACGTMFRVVQDQLRVSEGWVRCGRCDTVFNALDALVDLEAEAAGAVADSTPSDEAFYEPPGVPQGEVEDGPHRRPAPSSAPESRLDGNETDLVDDRPSAAPPERTWPREEAVPSWAVERNNDQGRTAASATLPVEPPPAAIWRPSSESPTPETTQTLAAATAAHTPTPTFVRRAERDARWTSPAMRAALIGGILILTGVLAMQAVYHFRDTVAASSPAADSLLRSACARWGCRIEAPRRIEQVTLEGSGLSRMPQQEAAVKLAINLRNRGHTDLMMPSVDLSLTDAKGALIARRVLAPADFRVDPPRIRRGAELPLELVLSTGERAIAGYTVELFYP